MFGTLVLKLILIQINWEGNLKIVYKEKVVLLLEQAPRVSSSL